jgi:hypothetical protein
MSKVEIYHEVGSITFFRNVGDHEKDYMVPQPRRPLRKTKKIVSL